MSNKRKPWMFWVLLVVFSAAGVWAQNRVLPPGHWSGRLIVETLPPLLAGIGTTLYLRARGLSQEARLEIIWLNVRRLMIEAPRVPDVEIKPSSALKWLITSLGVMIMAFFLWLRFCVPLDRQEGRELALPLIAFFALVTVLWWTLMSRPTMRLGADGVSRLGSGGVPWEQIASCRVFSKRNAWGVTGEPKVSVTGTDGRQITVFNLGMTPHGQRRDFLLTLHFALLPHEASPLAEIDRVLGL